MNLQRSLAVLCISFSLHHICAQDIDTVAQRNSAISALAQNASCEFRIIDSNPNFRPEVNGLYTARLGKIRVIANFNGTKYVINVNQELITSDNFFSDGKVISSISQNNGGGIGVFDIRPQALLMFYSGKLKLIDFAEFVQGTAKLIQGVETAGSMTMVRYKFPNATAIYTFDATKNYLLIKVEYLEPESHTIREVVEIANVNPGVYLPKKVTNSRIINGAPQVESTVIMEKWKLLNDAGNELPSWQPHPNSLVQDLVNQCELKYDSNAKLISKVNTNRPPAIANPDANKGASSGVGNVHLPQIEQTRWTRFLMPISLLALGTTGLFVYFRRKKGTIG